MTELRYIKWGKVLRDLTSREAISTLAKGKSLQWWLSLGLRKQNIMAIQLDKIDELVLEYRESRFLADVPNYIHIFSIYKDYNLDKIEKGDTVVDLGASIGAFAIPASRRAKMVYAIEPLYSELLRKNVELNKVNNIKILGLGIGISDSEVLEFMGMKKRCAMIDFPSLKEEVGKIDFLKIDCEGCEYSINPKELEGIRTIVGEFHFCLDLPKGCWKAWQDWFVSNNYELTIKKSSFPCWVRFMAERRKT